jgi:hypothetical protein
LNPINLPELAERLRGFGLTVVENYETPLTGIKVPILLPDLKIALFNVPPSTVDLYSLRLTLADTDFLSLVPSAGSFGLTQDGLLRLLEFRKVRQIAKLEGIL